MTPDRRRNGVARDLVETMIEQCRDAGVREIHTGNCAPRYVWPGVDLSQTEALACFQDLGFEAYDHGLNMLLPTTYRAAPPAGISIERETGDGAIELARREFPHWEDEVTRGIAKGTTFVGTRRDRDGRSPLVPTR